MPVSDGGLGSHLVGDKIQMGARNLHVTKLIGEGGFSYVYQCKELQESGISSSSHDNSNQGDASTKDKQHLVLKVTSIHSRSQRDIAEKEAKLLSRLSHPSIIKMYDTCYRTVAHAGSSSKKGGSSGKERPQHLILIEYCEGGHALDVCTKLASAGSRFDLSTLIIAFGQICNAVSYLHAQRPPIVHRDLKPVNFLVKNGAYKLCDFGSAVFGHVDLRTPKARAEAEEVVQKTTTQMFRAPEMVDLYMAKKLTQATDVWALGCCLYSLAFLQNCFEEGSNLAILSRKYTIPEDNPYGEGLVELLDRMLTVDSKARADMTEVILCLSAVYSGRPLPPRKKSSSKHKSASESDDGKREEKKGNKDEPRTGAFRTDGQGIQEVVYDPTKATEGKKLASNSVAARRKRAAAANKPPSAPTTSSSMPPPSSSSDPLAFSSFHSEFGKNSGEKGDDGFGGTAAFGEMQAFDTKGDANASDFFGSFEDAKQKSSGDANNAFDAAFDTGNAFETAFEGGAAPSDQAQEAESVPASSQDEAGDDAKGDKKDRSRRRRAGESSRSTNRRGPTSTNSIESGVEGVNLGEDDKKDRKARSAKVGDDQRRRRSGSRSRRKRTPREAGRSDRDPAGTKDPAGSSFRTGKKVDP